MARALGAEAHGDERGVAGSEGAAGAVDVQQCSLLGLGAAALLAAAARVSSRSLTRSCSYEGHGKESGVGGRVGQGREADRPDVPAILGRVLAPQEEHGAAQLQHGSQRRRAPVSALPRAHIRQMRQPEPRAARTSPAWLTRSAPSLPQTRASRRCASAARLQCSSHCNTLTLQHPSCIAATQLAGSPLAWGRRELEICRANVGGVWVYCHDQRGGGVLDTPRHTQACACVHPPRARAHTHTHTRPKRAESDVAIVGMHAAPHGRASQGPEGGRPVAALRVPAALPHKIPQLPSVPMPRPFACSPHRHVRRFR